ncbi:response regulator transcription factor [Agromyces sp. ISL-38]|uniref:winged helix-turn-helix transcriptional regulator n=1 Tax=Agromyces sp. ISL-38 TaxID=2819107 RepID=UPI001BE60958|nr:response regulator transcription factor [Agromyces sp. ISL-38]MBT2499450.1 response regulator transcription factor [Agromyces sp. ISL-38]
MLVESGNTAAAGDRAHAHDGAPKIALAAPRWPARVLFIESRSAPGHPVDSFETHGFEIHGYRDAIGALLAARSAEPAAIVAPTDMVNVDFLSFIEAMAASSDVPVIVGLATHENATELAYQAIARGARSILALPCRAEQLIAAVRACGIRMEPSARPLRVGELILDPQAFKVSIGDATVTLTPREFLLVHCLMRASPRVVGVEELASALAVHDDGSVAATRVLVTRVRKKFETAAPESSHLLETVRGIGYRINDG